MTKAGKSYRSNNIKKDLANSRKKEYNALDK